MKNINYLLVLTFLSMVYLAQGQTHCKCRINKIENKNNNRNPKGRYEYVISSNRIQHPITTFSRISTPQFSWFDENKNQGENLLKLREELRKSRNIDSTLEAELLDYYEEKFKPLYNDIINTAKGQIKGYNINNESVSIDAKIAKAAAFVLLVNQNDSGAGLTDSQKQFYYSQAVNTILRLDWKTFKNETNYGDDYFYKSISTGHTSKQYWINKSLTMLLQSYDYLKAVYPDSANVINCGYLLQCFTRHIFKASLYNRLGALNRSDNHALMTAGTIGLAPLKNILQTKKHTTSLFIGRKTKDENPLFANN